MSNRIVRKRNGHCCPAGAAVNCPGIDVAFSGVAYDAVASHDTAMTSPSADLIPIAFACPVDKSPLTDELECVVCDRRYPRVHGVPVLLNEQRSVFRTADYLSQAEAYGGASDYGGKLDRTSGIRRSYRKIVHSIRERPLPRREFDTQQAVRHIKSARPDARILVIGAGETSIHTDAVKTDVAFGPHVTCIADAHDLPFPDGSFDACIACAVLEHVADPARCVAEMVRVLNAGGFVYAETPFMVPVHMKAHDFTRFTFLGHRRLFNRFDDIRSGVCGGPGVAAAQMLNAAVCSLSDRPAVKRWLRLVGLLASFPLRWLDHLAAPHLSAYDCAHSFYFFGSRREEAVPDFEILRDYRGG